jgi:hypothetical protein
LADGASRHCLFGHRRGGEKNIDGGESGMNSCNLVTSFT